MRAAARFAKALEESGEIARAKRVGVELFGSLAATGRGHGTDRAILMGLEGHDPLAVDPEAIPDRVAAIRAQGTLSLSGHHQVAFPESEGFSFRRGKRLPGHPNAMRFTAYGDGEEPVFSRVYYSVGGGSVRGGNRTGAGEDGDEEAAVPHPFRSASELLAACRAQDMSVSELMLANERALRSEEEIRAGLSQIWTAMRECAWRGVDREGVLPGGLRVRRRAPELYRTLSERAESAGDDPLDVLDWVNLWALAVNEENAAGGRVVTAPTNGAAGIIPAVVLYYDRFVSGASEEGVMRLLLTAAAIGSLYRQNASISGAEVGCQGEVGVACSMAAGGLAEVFGGSPAHVENAAEIGMEHNLGLTCDPVGGLVQVPCIERNAMGANKAINAARMALAHDGEHFVSLDKVIQTMRQIGADMKTKYKETARGGLAVNVVEC